MILTIIYRLVLKLLNFATRPRLNLRNNSLVSRRSSPNSVSNRLPTTMLSQLRSLRLESPLPEFWLSSTSLRESNYVSSTRPRSISPKISVPSRLEPSDEDFLHQRPKPRLLNRRRARKLSLKESTPSKPNFSHVKIAHWCIVLLWKKKNSLMNRFLNISFHVPFHHRFYYL